MSGSAGISSYASATRCLYCDSICCYGLPTRCPVLRLAIVVLLGARRQAEHAISEGSALCST
eukprot:1746920-Rhodomonas_salina.1